MPEDSIAAMPVGEEIALAVDLPEKPDESIFLDSVSLEDFETELVRVPSFGKHKKNAFYQRHPDPSWNSRTVGCVDVGMGDVYVCSPKVLPHLMEHGVVKRRIYTLQDRDGDIRFCGYKVPDEDGNLDTWNQSAHRILAEDDSATTWFKFISMKKAGKYMKRRAISQDMRRRNGIWIRASMRCFLRRSRIGMSTTWIMPSPKPFSGLSNQMGPITNIEELFQHYREIVVLDANTSPILVSGPFPFVPLPMSSAPEGSTSSGHTAKGIRKRNLPGLMEKMF